MIGEENRHKFCYGHFALAVRTDFDSRHCGRYQLGAHDVSFRPTNVRRAKIHPGLGARQSEKRSWKLSRSLCDSGSISKIMRLLWVGVEAKKGG
jgi:hypothetical protein